MTDAHPYPHLPASPDLPATEKEILRQWAEQGTFEASIAKREGCEEFVFYDGPPFANGLPHYGHLFTGFIKDTIPRHRTMRGAKVPRNFGWDCHGLPAELEAERQLGISGHEQIEQYGVARFNDYCATSVQQYTQDWRSYVTRQARWVDFDNDYRTMDIDFMESVMWAFKQLYDKGLIYEGFRVLPYSWAAQTVLSNQETRMDDATRERQDPALTVAFTVTDAPESLSGGKPLKMLAWTTTPWTLPSNLALVVRNDMTYVVMELDDVRYVLSKSRLGAYEKEFGDALAVATVKGEDLVGLCYEPLLPYFKDHPGAFLVLSDDYVTDDDGTGIVHTAPGFGEDDMRICAAHGIGVVVPVDDTGAFTAEVADFAGQNVFEANRGIIRKLAEEAKLIREDSYLHNYPHCWRTGQPLIQRAMSSWFVAVTKIKDRLLANNEKITWTPEHVKDGAFGKWLENAHDWSISRNRFWGSPIPVWQSDDPRYPRVDVYGSLDELERDFGVRPTDLHRPYIDDLTRPNPDDPTGKSTMRRVQEVLDCWFESGSMGFAQVHYPFENKEWFDSHFPADFIVEYVGQTRGWFYTQHVMATALFDQPNFLSCIAHGILLGEDGLKLSKKLRNYPDPLEAFSKYGSDAMRWSLLSSPAMRGGNLVVGEKAMAEAIREAVLPLWNATYFFTTYANTGGRRAVWRTDAPGLLDRYILAKAHKLVANASTAFDSYDLSGAAACTATFVDALNNWYIRRSRDRFWGTSTTGEPDPDALDTLYTVLEVLCRVAAPLLPLTTEKLWTTLTGEQSVHLAEWPSLEDLPADDELVREMDIAREVCSATHAIRKEQGLRVRLPLAAVTVAGPRAHGLSRFAEVIGDEVNVKEVHTTDEIGSLGELVLAVQPKVLGPRLGKQVQQVLKAAKLGEWHRDEDGTVTVGGEPLEEGEFILRLTPANPAVARTLPGDDTLVVLDTELTPELEAEGTARDLVRLIQERRKKVGLQVTDRIMLTLGLPNGARTAAETHHKRLAADTLAISVAYTDAPLGTGEEGVVHMAGVGHVAIGITKA